MSSFAEDIHSGPIAVLRAHFREPAVPAKQNRVL